MALLNASLPAYWLAIGGLLGGCVPRQQLDLQVDSSGCLCKLSRLELYLLARQEGCVRAAALAPGLGGENVLTSAGDRTGLVALVLGFSSGEGRDLGLQGEARRRPDVGGAADAGSPADISPWNPCGDKVCEYPLETCQNCPLDCGRCEAGLQHDLLTSSKCGNTICEPSESCGSCPIDCGTCGDGLLTTSCHCCYGLTLLAPEDTNLFLRLTPSASCRVAEGALRAAGLPEGLVMPPGRCP